MMEAFGSLLCSVRESIAPETHRRMAHIAVSSYEQFRDLPDWNLALQGTDSENGQAMTAVLSASGREYHCLTCAADIAGGTQHIVIGGLRRTWCDPSGGQTRTTSHHHLHTDCFHNHELVFWNDVSVTDAGVIYMTNRRKTA